MHEFNELFLLILLLLSIAVGTRFVAKMFRLPDSILLVVVGLFFGVIDVGFTQNAEEFITSSVIFQVFIISIFLPALLGEATSNIPFTHIKENIRPILALAFGGTFITFALVGIGSYHLIGFSIATAFVYAALMSATDPISVTSIFKTMGVNKKIMTTVEGESLFNDAVAVVLFQIGSIYLLDYIDKGWMGFALGLWLFIKVLLGGIAIGGILGYLASRWIQKIDDYALETKISILLFFGAFLIAETFHFSGVIATVVSGIILWSYGKETGMSPATRLSIKNFWDIIANIANSLIFLMVGLEIGHIDFSGKWSMIVLAILIVLASRSIAVYASLFTLKEFPSSWKHLLNWGGLKGSLSIALALSLPHSFSGREDILVLTFSTVIFSLLVQGLTIKPLIKKLGIISNKPGIIEYESTQVKMQMLIASLDELENEKLNSFISLDLYEEEKKKLESELDRYRNKMKELQIQFPQIKEEQRKDLYKLMLYAQYDRLMQLEKKEIVSDDELLEQEKLSLIEKIDKNEMESH